MNQLGRFAALACALLLIVPPAFAAYGSPLYRQAEPSTTYDVGNMFDETDALSGDHAYLNGFPTIYAVGPSPTLTDADSTTPPQLLYLEALMGFWRDCNGDGFIGSAAMGMEVYPVSIGYEESICPPGDGPTENAYYVNPAGDGFVNEFLWIGPDYYWDAETGTRTKETGYTPVYGGAGIIGPSFEERNDPRNVNDQDARVWADFGLPDSQPTATPVLFPFPKGSLQTWEGNLALADAYLGLGETLGPHGVSYDAILEVGRTLDGAHVPSPLGIAKNLYNSSTAPDGGDPDCGRSADDPCTGAYGQPFIVVWDCERAAEGTTLGPVTNPVTGEQETVHLAPPLRPGSLNANGSWGGTYYQLGRGLGYDDPDGDGTPECDDAAHGGAAGRVYGYWNLERTASGGEAAQKKTSTDVSFYYYPKSRFHEPGEDDPRRGSGGNVTVPYTGLVDGADRHAGTGYGGFYFRGWKASNYHVFTPSAAHPLGALGEAYAPSIVTFYGYSDLSVGEFPADGRYGEDHCTDGFGPGLPGDGFWECDPDHPDWQDFLNSDPDRNVVVGQPYDVRDVDCYDNTLAGLTTPRAAGGSDCQSLGLTVS